MYQMIAYLNLHDVNSRPELQVRAVSLSMLVTVLSKSKNNREQLMTNLVLPI